MIANFLKILGLQSQISKVFWIAKWNIFSHNRSEQFWKQNTILLFRSLKMNEWRHDKWTPRHYQNVWSCNVSDNIMAYNGKKFDSILLHVQNISNIGQKAKVISEKSSFRLDLDFDIFSISWMCRPRIEGTTNEIGANRPVFSGTYLLRLVLHNWHS